jgi:hypothetical protein
MNVRRIVVYAVLVALLPGIVGFLAGVSSLLHGQSTTPSWVHGTRVVVAWATVIFVFARLAIVQRDRLPLHIAAVTLLGWLLGEIMQFALLRLIGLVPGAAPGAPYGPFDNALPSLLIDVARAAVGAVGGIMFVRLRKRSIRPAG